MNDKSKKEADFGYKKVNPNEKPDLVKGVFDSVASKYDLMNDVMSVGIHRLWKKATVQMSNLKANDSVLDVAGGTGDMAILFSEIVGDQGKVFLTDINEKMLEIGRDRVLDSGLLNVKSLVADAEDLPFPDNSFDVLVNVESSHCYGDVTKFLKESYRVLKKDGYFLFCDFRTADGLQELYDQFSSSELKFLNRIDITDNIIKGLDKLSKYREDHIDESVSVFIRKLFKTYAGIKGTEIYNSFVNGSMIYVCAILKK